MNTSAKRPLTPRPEARRPILVRREWLRVSLLTLVTAIVWVGISTYLAYFASATPDAQRRRLEQFSTQLDESVLDELSGRRQLSDVLIDELQRVTFTPLSEAEIQESDQEATESAQTPEGEENTGEQL